ncbi:hypothetical protein [Neorhizobium alkalisoli]|uniref:hypothetical protein n=1 Tax=Neorhizobium alkalisoli TaxID=528178 RepID=UPI001319DF37|nr:hypothetical protein [Neorhizobium alkalisoli]
MRSLINTHTVIVALALSTFAGGGAYAKQLGHALPASNVSIMYIEPEADQPYMPDAASNPSKADILAAQQEIRTDAALRATLVQHNVELNNVVDIGVAADGSRTVYVR